MGNKTNATTSFVRVSVAREFCCSARSSCAKTDYCVNGQHQSRLSRGSRVYTVIYILEQGEQRPGHTPQGLEAQKAPVLSSCPRTRTMLQLAKSPRDTKLERGQPCEGVTESRASPSQNTTTYGTREIETETVTSTRESREQSVCCS